jgi:23S rRNA pseudouridine1911/1915/1917 synthase
LEPAVRIVHLQVDKSGERLDRYLARAITDLSRSRLQQLIRTGQVTINGQTARPSTMVTPGMWISACIPAPLSDDICPQPIALDVIYEDADLLVIDKPAGMVVHPATGHQDGTLVNALLARYPNLAVGDEGRPGIVHRLDRDTSGLMVVARSQRALENLREQFKSRRVKKTYLALVHGHPPAAEGIIEAPIGRDPQHRQRMAVLPGVRAARTTYRLVRQLGNYALLAVSPDTGRTHQIRVHLAWIGLPVVGDRVYGHRRKQTDAPRQFLHAWRLSFDHPCGNGRIDLESPLPADLRQALRQIGDAAGDKPEEIAQLGN